MDLDNSEFEDIPKIKIVFLGDRSVGKSSIVKRFIRDEFDNNQNVSLFELWQPTVGIDYMSKQMEYRGRRYKLELWDTAGQEKYRSLVKNYLKDADCALFVHDVNGITRDNTDIRTYNHISDWMRTFREATSRDPVCLVVGNKIDLRQESKNTETTHTGDSPIQSPESMRTSLTFRETKKDVVELEHFEVSAKLGTNITSLFSRVIQKTLARNVFSARYLPESTKLIKGVGEKLSRCCQ